MPINNKKTFKLLDYVVLSLLTFIFITLFLFLWSQLVPLWTMNITSKSIDISTFRKTRSTRKYHSKTNPLRVEIITDFDKLCISKLTFNKILNLTIREEPNILVFMGKTGENGRVQNKLQNMFYLLSRFKIKFKRIFIIPDRDFYEQLLSSTKPLVYYVDFFKNMGAEVVFEGIEYIDDSLTFIMASSRDRIEFLKGTLAGTIIFLADDPKEKVNDIIAELFITTKMSSEFKHKPPSNLLIVKKGITFLNIY